MQVDGSGGSCLCGSEMDQYRIYGFMVSSGVTGAPYREVNSKVATALKLKVEDKDSVNNS